MGPARPVSGFTLVFMSLGVADKAPRLRDIA